MDFTQIREHLKLACAEYYDILSTKCLGGMAITDVTRIKQADTPDMFYLSLSAPVNPQYLDSSLIAIGNEIHPSIRIRTASRKPPRICIQVPKSLVAKFSTSKASNVKVVSDLKYLVKRLGEYYSRSTLQLPSRPSVPAPLPSPFTDAMTAEQFDAYNGVFASNVCYVWGAPGTGKTSMVLSRCVLRYVLAGQRILLLAPTNNAIEQVLRSVIPVMDQAGIDPFYVYRFGTSSEEFAKEFPHIVGSEHLEVKQRELSDQIAKTVQQIDSAKDNAARFLQKEQRLMRKHASLSDAFSSISPLIDKLVCLNQNIEDCAYRVSLHTKFRDAANAELSLAYTDLQQCRQHRNACFDALRSVNAKISSWKFSFYSRSKKSMYRSEQAQLSSSFSDASTELQDAEHRLNIKKDAAASAERNFQSALEEESRALREFEQHKKQTVSKIESNTFLSPYWNACEEIDAFCSSVLSAIDDAAQQLDMHKKSKPSDNLAFMEAHLKELQAELCAIGETSVLSKKRRALVLAGTFDSALAILPVPENELPISHAFIDEAGYTSVARGMVPFSLGCPVAMFGDHKQLPPVCEATRTELSEKENANLFALSIAHYASVCSSSISELAQFASSSVPPLFDSSFPMYPLNLSFRFGESLAALLGEHFYSSDFHGASEDSFDFELIHAVNNESRSRSNKGETNAIIQYLKNHPDEDHVVLSPYKKQVELILSKVGKLIDHDHVLTVHRSQGREWDAVIFSVTDFPPGFLVNSSLPDGRQVLATAISRAKRKLILVCDTEAWLCRPHQFIGQIVLNFSTRGGTDAMS